MGSKQLEHDPFGMLLVGRNGPTSGSEEYRFGFNGIENDDDIYADDNSLNFGARIYNPRLGKFLSIDPLTKVYADLTPYQFASNRPIKAIDIDGLAAWDGPNDAKRVLTLHGYSEFATTLLEKITSGEIQMQCDCADLALYLLAKYYESEGVELSYVVPNTNIIVSSSDERFQDFDDFYKGLEGETGVLGYGLRGNIGAIHLKEDKWGFTSALSEFDEGAIAGDLVTSPTHAAINYPDAAAENFPFGVIQAQPSYPTGEFYPNGKEYYGGPPYKDNYSKDWGQIRRWNILLEIENTNFIDSPIPKISEPGEAVPTNTRSSEDFG